MGLRIARRLPTLQLALAVLAFLLAFPARADDLDDLARHAMAAQRIPGMATLVTQSGRGLRRAAYGEAGLERLETGTT